VGMGEVTALLVAVAGVLTAAGVVAEGIAKLVKALRRDKQPRADLDDQAVDKSA
jgi:hypothetical protein